MALYQTMIMTRKTKLLVNERCLVLCLLALGLILGDAKETQAQTKSAMHRAHNRSRQSQQPPQQSRSLTPPPAANERQADRQGILAHSLLIRDVKQGQIIDLIATNLTRHYVTFSFLLTTRNLKDIEERNATVVLSPNGSQSIQRMAVIHPGRPWHYRFNINLQPGKLLAEHDKTAVYRLPYRIGTSHRVVQAYGGRFTHQGNIYFSIDFAMKPGTPIHAARAGVVAGTKSDSQKSGNTKDFLDFANYVSIAHADGTYAEYAHLKYQGVEVEMGEHVKQGQLIGYSGNTGYSKGPHLHFAVLQVTSAEDSTTIPVTFLTDQGVVGRLRTHHDYLAVAPPKNSR